MEEQFIVHSYLLREYQEPVLITPVTVQLAITTATLIFSILDVADGALASVDSHRSAAHCGLILPVGTTLTFEPACAGALGITRTLKAGK